MSAEEKIRVTVEIYGQTYTVLGTESPEHIKRVAKNVDDAMHLIRENNPSLDLTRIAVLTALNTENERMKLAKRLQSKEDDTEG